MPESAADNPASEITVRSKWLFPGDRPGWENGWISIRDDRVVALGQGHPDRVDIDLGDVAILPGLINAHTHLEFSSLACPLGQSRRPFPKWIEAVIKHRGELPADAQERALLKTQSIRRGLQESYQAGICAVGEIASVPWDKSQYLACPLKLRLFHEFLGLSPERSQLARNQLPAELLAETAAEDFDQLEQASLLGLSPHAPYTVNLEDVAHLGRLAGRRQIPIAMHLAESPDELRLLQSHQGAFVELLQSLGAWDSSRFPAGIGIGDYLSALACAKQVLVIHGNYLSSGEIQWLGQRSDQFHVVYCPRTQDFFFSDPYPLDALLASGVSVLLGTDSRASNPDLSVWREVQFVAPQYPQVPSDRLLAMVTTVAAEAIGWSHAVGCLAVGKLWRAVGFSASGIQGADPLRALMETHESQPRPLWPLDALAPAAREMNATG